MNTLILVGISVLAFWILIYILSRIYDFESINLEFNPGVLMWRTERGIGLLDRIAEAKERFWKTMGNISALLGSGLMFAVFGFLLYLVIIYVIQAMSPSGPPSVPSEVGTKIVPIPGLNIPFLKGAIALITVLFIHEGAHGIILRNLKIKVKSVGLALFVLIPGAFVEQDEEDFKEADPLSRVKVASAGPVANVILAFVCLGVIFALISPNPGVPIENVYKNTPAKRAGLQPGTHIIEINDETCFNYADFNSVMQNTRPGQTITLKTDKNQYQITLGEHPTDNEIGYIGIAATYGPLKSSTLLGPQFLFFTIPTYTILGSSLIAQNAYTSVAPWFFVDLLIWIFSLNILVAIFNLLPMRPLDGGHLFEGLAEKVTTGRKKVTIVNAMRSLVIMILVVNIMAIFIG